MEEQYKTITLDSETSKKLMKHTKSELIEKFCVIALEAKLLESRLEVAHEDTRNAQDEKEKLQTKLELTNIKLTLAESYVEQARAMINAIMDRWYEYDA